jgi:transcriptional antiterminator RfaH
MDWYVLHLRPRCEKKMAEHCRVNKLSHYLPLRQETKVYQRRKVTVEKPVFPGYFFVGFDAEGRATVLKTNNVVRILVPGRRRQLLHELAQIRKALAADRTLGTVAAMTSGKRVRITGGPFMGIEGTVTVVKGKNMVRLNVELIGRAVAVEVQREFLEIVDGGEG